MSFANIDVASQALRRRQRERERERYETAAQDVYVLVGRCLTSDTTAPPSLEVKTLTLDLESLDERGFVSVSNARKLINEEYREIKRKLLKNAFGALSKSIEAGVLDSTAPSSGIG